MIETPKRFAEILTERVIQNPNLEVGSKVTVQEQYKDRISREAVYEVVAVNKDEAELELESLVHKITFNKRIVVDFEGDPDELNDIFSFEMEEPVDVHTYLVLRIGKSRVPYEVVECVRIPKGLHDVVEEEKYLVTAHTWRPMDMGWDEYLTKMEAEA